MRHARCVSTGLMALTIAMSFITTFAERVLASTAAILLPANSAEQTLSDFTIGYDFKVGSASLLVTSLGRIDLGADGLINEQQVGIFSASEVLLASVTIPAGTGSTLINGWRYVDLTTPLLLAANTSYTVGATTNNDPTHATGNAGEGLEPTFSSDITLIGRDYAPGSGLNAPFIKASAADVIAWDAGNFLYTAAPEPDTVVLLGLGVLGIGFGGYCKRKQK